MLREKNERCVVCGQRLPTKDCESVEGLTFCQTCIIEQYANLPTSSETSDRSTLQKTKTHSKEKRYASSVSLNLERSSNVFKPIHRIGSAISNVFRKPQLPPQSANRPDADHQRAVESSTRTCQVCFDQQPLNLFRPISHHQQCRQSPRSICDICVYQHIQQTFQDVLTDTVNCPELTCQLPFDYQTIRAILLLKNNHKLLERYDRFLIHHQLEQMDEFIWCSNTKCQMGQFNEGGQANNIVTCRSCHRKTCFTHKTPWHTGLTCQEHDLTIGGELKASLQWLHQNTKTCPKCPYQIEKNDGCDHMTCIKCQHEFCWCCLADYARIREDGNHRHHPHCKHYAVYDGGY